MQFRGYCEWNYGRAWPFCLNCVPIIYTSDNITLEDMIKFDGKFLRKKISRENFREKKILGKNFAKKFCKQILRENFRGKIFARKNLRKNFAGKNFTGQNLAGKKFVEIFSWEIKIEQFQMDHFKMKHI